MTSSPSNAGPGQHAVTKLESVAQAISVGALIAAPVLALSAFYFAYGTIMGDGSGIVASEKGNVVAKIWLGVALANCVSVGLTKDKKRRNFSVLVAAIYCVPTLLLIILRLTFIINATR